MSFNNLRVATKLWTAVAAIMLALILLLLGTSMRASAQQELMDATLAELNTRTQVANQWYAATLANSVRVTAVVISSDPAIETTFKSAIADTTGKISELQKTIVAMQLSTDEKAQMEKIAGIRKNVISLRDAAR